VTSLTDHKQQNAGNPEKQSLIEQRDERKTGHSDGDGRKSTCSFYERENQVYELETTKTTPRSTKQDTKS